MIILCLCHISNDAWLEFFGTILGSIIAFCASYWAINSAHKSTTKQITSSSQDNQKQIKSINDDISKLINNDKIQTSHKIKNDNKRRKRNIAFQGIIQLNALEINVGKFTDYIHLLLQKLMLVQFTVSPTLQIQFINKINEQLTNENNKMAQKFSELSPYFYGVTTKTDLIIKRFRDIIIGLTVIRFFINILRTIPVRYSHTKAGEIKVSHDLIKTISNDCHSIINNDKKIKIAISNLIIILRNNK